MVETVVQHGCGWFIDLQDWVVVLGVNARKLSVLAMHILKNNLINYAMHQKSGSFLGGAQSIPQSETKLNILNDHPNCRVTFQ